MSRPWLAAVLYLGITLALTWPLALRLGSSLPSDLGDPVFVSWVIAWGAEHWIRLLSGDVGAVTSFWNPGMFHPEPMVTVFSEHLALHSLQVAPVWAATRNALLCYNLLFLSSYALSGFGAYLLVRELTGAPRAAFVAGLVFMCTPYRLASLSHLQVLSAQWMPFVFWGLRHYFTTGRRAALLAASVALALQNLASGYYLVFFGPFVVLYVLFELTWRGKWRGRVVWRDLFLGGLVAAAVTLPFALPYAVLKFRSGYRRALSEIEPQSADVLSWLSPDPRLMLWGGLDPWTAPSHLFLGVTPLLLAAAGTGIALFAPARLDHLRAASPRRIAVFCLLGICVAAWAGLGPVPRFNGEALDIPSLFALLYAYVPGFDVSRAPSRFTMVVVLLLSVLAGYAAAAGQKLSPRALPATMATLIVLEGAAWPLPADEVFWPNTHLARPAGRVFAEREAPPIWRFLRTLPAGSVIAQFPFGFSEYEIRYLFYSDLQRYRTTNGYSGIIPASYVYRANVLREPLIDPDATVAQLRKDHVTHIVVHANAWTDDTGVKLRSLLETAGARKLLEVDDATVHRLLPERLVRHAGAAFPPTVEGTGALAASLLSPYVLH